MGTWLNVWRKVSLGSCVTLTKLKQQDHLGLIYVDIILKRKSVYLPKLHLWAIFYLSDSSCISKNILDFLLTLIHILSILILILKYLDLAQVAKMNKIHWIIKEDRKVKWSEIHFIQDLYFSIKLQKTCLYSTG